MGPRVSGGCQYPVRATDPSHSAVTMRIGHTSSPPDGWSQVMFWNSERAWVLSFSDAGRRERIGQENSSDTAFWQRTTKTGYQWLHRQTWRYNQLLPQSALCQRDLLANNERLAKFKLGLLKNSHNAVQDVKFNLLLASPNSVLTVSSVEAPKYFHWPRYLLLLGHKVLLFLSVQNFRQQADLL